MNRSTLCLLALVGAGFTSTTIADCGDRLDRLEERYPLAMKEIGDRDDVRQRMRSARLLIDSEREGLCNEVVDDLAADLAPLERELASQRRENRIADARPIGEQAGITKATALIGQIVRNREDRKLGTVVDVALDQASGSVAYVVLEFGGFLGLSKNYAAIPWQQLARVKVKQEVTWVVDISREALQQRASFEYDDWPQGKLNDYPRAAAPTAETDA